MMKSNQGLFVGFFIVSSLAFTTSSMAEIYELVIKNGRVIDPESGLDENRWLGISEGKIIKVSKEAISGKKTIDATGLVVAPGFIDLHSHSQLLPSARLQVFDGVTTALELESGVLEVDTFYERIAKEGRPINYGASASWTMARAAVLDDVSFRGIPGEALSIFSLPNWSTKLTTKLQQEKVISLVEKELDSGALGIGIMTGYSPNSNRKEYYQLHKLAVKYNVPTFNHIRYISSLEPKSSFEAYQELISVAASTGAHAHISHLNSTSLRDIEDVAELIKSAQEQGVNVSVEAYPYSAGSTAIGSQLFRGDGWRQRLGGVNESDFYHNGKALTAEEFKYLQDNNPTAVIVFHFLDPKHTEHDLKYYDIAQLFPNGAVASDAMPMINSETGQLVSGDIWPLPEKAKAHPRSAGTYSRFIRQFVKERKKLPLIEAIRKMTLEPARILEGSVEQMRYKGRIREGFDADIVIFDLEELTDRATFSEPTLTSQGMKSVIVNGTLVIENGELNRNALPGQPIRRGQIKDELLD